MGLNSMRKARAKGMRKLNLKSKKLFTVRLDEAVIRDIKLLSVDTGKPISELVEEAIAEAVRKHGRTEVAYSTTATEAKKVKK